MKAVVVGLQYVLTVIVADDKEDEAYAVADGLVQAGELKPIDRFTVEAKTIKDVPSSWRDQPPFVAPSVTDEAFAAITRNGEGIEAILATLKR